ncbi:MAG: glycosyltransferase family 39 protein, partial [Gaiellales bacterium]
MLPLSVWVVVVAGLQAVVLVATSTRYGYHRDELYFIVAGWHRALGYPDQPSLVPLFAALMHGLAPGSLLVLRLPSAIAAALTTVLAALIAREVGGSRRVQVLAAACTASSGFALAVGHITSTTTFDMLSTSAFLWLVIRALARQSGPSLLAAGIVVGIGLEAKPQVGVAAAAATVVLALPYLVWQQQHGWPQVTVAGNIAGSAEGGRAGFVPFQLVMVSPFLVPVWIAALI